MAEKIRSEEGGLEKDHLDGIVDYVAGMVPDNYRCDVCGAHGVKLWRECRSTAFRTKLFCVHCAEKDQRDNLAGCDSLFSSGIGDGIGSLCPAVPVAGKSTYWGYASIPEEGTRWWEDLPT
jgi:hypothetical protein